VLLISGGRLYEAGNTERETETLPSEAQLMLSFALAAGVPRSAIQLLDRVGTVCLSIRHGCFLTGDLLWKRVVWSRNQGEDGCLVLSGDQHHRGRDLDEAAAHTLGTAHARCRDLGRQPRTRWHHLRLPHARLAARVVRCCARVGRSQPRPAPATPIRCRLLSARSAVAAEKWSVAQAHVWSANPLRPGGSAGCERHPLRPFWRPF
jgi:hypothetical protein